MAFRNPQFPSGRQVPIPQAAPTESMPLIGYQTEGRIAGIQQGGNFQPFTQGPHRGHAIQGFIQLGSGIQLGQTFSQPLINTPEG